MNNQLITQYYNTTLMFIPICSYSRDSFSVANREREVDNHQLQAKSDRLEQWKRTVGMMQYCRHKL